jgi:hypothetical protein
MTCDANTLTKAANPATGDQNNGEQPGLSTSHALNPEPKTWHAPRCRQIALTSTEAKGSWYTDGVTTRDS